ncbi:TasA family protein [Protaetiibacter intestinalis]|uniref:Ribosomally synthesized peptide with SipW-like signal peptide n=1 Tax=Protaetiibacter intestinalis TaxID=2419774 RepID=A0A387B4X0_9MICO|nr:TasA family protein [Protaetiibacter intestinalis]AYF98632.1 hypothetical protein D7I47_10410 [Protaetiibacter intestinalis]
MPAHLAAPAPISRLRRATRAVFGAVAAFAAAIVIALGAAGGTYAYFSSSAQLNAGTITAGTADLTIQNVASYPIAGLDATALVPGASVFTSTPLTVKNTGDASLKVTQGAASFSTTGTLKDYLVIKVGLVGNGVTSCTAGLGTALGSGVTLAAGGQMKVCVTVTLSSSAPGSVAGQPPAQFTIPLDGEQVHP